MSPRAPPSCSLSASERGVSLGTFQKGASETRTHLGGYPRSAKQARVLVHVEGSAAHGIGLEDAGTEVVDETEGRDDEGSGAGQLLSTIWSRVIPAYT